MIQFGIVFGKTTVFIFTQIMHIPLILICVLVGALLFSSVEWRVNIYQVKARIREVAKNFQVIAGEYRAVFGLNFDDDLRVLIYMF